MIGGAVERAAPDLDACVEEARVLAEGGMKKREAARAVAERHHVSANEVYDGARRRRRRRRLTRHARVPPRTPTGGR